MGDNGEEIAKALKASFEVSICTNRMLDIIRRSGRHQSVHVLPVSCRISEMFS